MIRQIGAGGGGDVWLARSALGTYRAVKVIFRKSFSWSKPYEDEFHGLLKYEPLSRQHEALVDVLQVGGSSEADYFYYVMELGDDVRSGQDIDPNAYQPRTLWHYLAARKPLPVEECIRLGAPIASALSFLHEHGLIHRDVKPANIIFVNGLPKLADAGLVTEMFQNRSRVGTEGYIAPEGPGTARADIYSLGKVLYEMSTGNDRNEYPALPADMGSPTAERNLIQFNKLILKCCRTNPRLRHRDAKELESALTAFQVTPRKPFEDRDLRPLGWIAIAGLLAAAGVVAFVLWRLIADMLRTG
ncbi:MAG: serine/threonine-protein kinase [Negativicutes bacterium]|nr:serine/threonine-protein kinase [Negativicutes bacterium]